MATGRKGKTVREIVTEYPAPEIGQIPTDDEDSEQQEDRIPPEADEFIALLENIPGAASLKAQVYRVLESGGEQWLGTITAKDCNIASPQETIRARHGGGKFTVRAQHPVSGETIESTFDIEGPPKGERPPSPFSIHIPSNGKGGDTEAMASIFGAMMEMNNKYMMQMAEQQRESTKVLITALQARPTGSTAGIDEILKYKMLFDENAGASAKKLEQWISLGSLLVEKISAIIVPQSDNPWAAAFHSFGPKIMETLGAIGTNLAARRGLVPPGTPVTPTQTPAGSPTGPVAASAAPALPQLTEEQMKNARQYFEASILPDWMEAAERDEDPYSTKRNVRQLVGEDTRVVWHFLGLEGPAQFYSKYPKCAQYRQWFDDLFSYLDNPGKTPEEDEGNHAETPATTAEFVG